MYYCFIIILPTWFVVQDKKDVLKENGGEGTPGSFTPAHVSPNLATSGSTISKNNNSKTSKSYYINK